MCGAEKGYRRGVDSRGLGRPTGSPRLGRLARLASLGAAELEQAGGPSQGDEPAAKVEDFAALVRAHAGALRRTCRRLLQDATEADDAVQEAFLSAFAHLPTFRGQARPSTWLHRIAVNACLMRLRRRIALAPAIESDDCDAALGSLLPRYLDDGHRADPRPAWTASVDELCERRELCERVRRLVQSLPEPHRTVLVLRDLEELSTDETAALLGVRVNAVKTRLHRARQALRTMLERELVKEDLG
jgi:RNA polymerase sigma-70 factor (ECF subfamily)